MVEDYPRTLLELDARFGTDETCQAYLSTLRWPEGWLCPRCQGRQAWTVQRGLWRCRQCRGDVSVTAGTIFQDSHLPRDRPKLG